MISVWAFTSTSGGGAIPGLSASASFESVSAFETTSTLPKRPVKSPARVAAGFGVAAGMDGLADGERAAGGSLA